MVTLKQFLKKRYIQEQTILCYVIIFNKRDKMDQENIGRPKNEEIQTQFMKKIRGDKLQAINAECELEICLSFKYGDKKESTKNKRSKNKKKEAEDEDQNIQSLVESIMISNLEIDRRTYLHKFFQDYKGRWKFEQILQIKNLPQYFFDDGCDLSYIIYWLQMTGDGKFATFSTQDRAEDLIFLLLLCLEGRKLLNKIVVQYYQKNMDFIVLGIKNGLQKIEQKLKQVQNHNEIKKQKKSYTQQDPKSQNYQEERHQQRNEAQKKTKKIQKKNGAKPKKKPKSQDSQQQGEQNESQQKDYPGNTELAIKTCNYISWAYWYVVQKA